MKLLINNGLFMQTEILRSTKDRSINVVNPAADGGKIEARFVQRLDDTVIVYLSSASGCNKSCRFCHLTQTRQTMETHVNVSGYLKQANDVLELVASEGKLNGVKIVHFNFMARGDALSNYYFVNFTENVINGLCDIADKFNLQPKFKISTIFPKDFQYINEEHNGLDKWISHCLELHPELEIYYSLYSLDERFRKRWIPKSFDPEIIGHIFSGTVEKVTIHHALIDGENTSDRDIVDIGRWISRHNIKCRVNIVRYNPFSDACGREPSDDIIMGYQSAMAQNKGVMGVYIISRVGGDVKASCGTFVS